MLWDRGTWEPLERPARGPEEGQAQVPPPRQAAEGRLGAGPHAAAEAARSAKTGSSSRSEDEKARRRIGNWRMKTTSVASRQVDGRDSEGRRRLEAMAASESRTKRSTGKAKLSRVRPPQLATLVDEAPAGDDWLHEVKYDGYRAARRRRRRRGALLHAHGQDWTDHSRHRREPALSSAGSAPARWRGRRLRRRRPDRFLRPAGGPVGRRAATSLISSSTCWWRTARI